MNELQRRQATKRSGIQIFVNRDCADEMMRCFRKRRGLAFCRQQIEAAMNLKRVGAYNLRANFPRDIGCNFGFSGCCRADNKNARVIQSD